jgi:hypothetical protein
MARLRAERAAARLTLDPVEQYVEAAWAAYQLDPESTTCERGHLGCSPTRNGTCTDELLEIARPTGPLDLLEVKAA